MRSVFWSVRVSFYGHTWAGNKSWVNFGSSRFSLTSSFLTVLHLTAGRECAVMFCSLLRLLGVGSQFSWFLLCGETVEKVKRWNRWVFLVGVAILQFAIIQGSGFHTKLPGSCVLGSVCKLCVLAEATEELHRWRSNKRLSGWRHKLLPLLSLR